MSHRLFLDSICSNARVWAFLKQVDEAEAALWRSAGWSALRRGAAQRDLPAQAPRSGA